MLLFFSATNWSNFVFYCSAAYHRVSCTTLQMGALIHSIQIIIIQWSVLGKWLNDCVWSNLCTFIPFKMQWREQCAHMEIFFGHFQKCQKCHDVFVHFYLQNARRPFPLRHCRLAHFGAAHPQPDLNHHGTDRHGLHKSNQIQKAAKLIYQQLMDKNGYIMRVICASVPIPHAAFYAKKK